MPASRTSPRPPPKIDLALQGGGSHGAFSWGVLDRLLEDESLAFAGISGTSAGAINAAVMATGFARGGRAGAREALAAFWRDTSRSGSPFSPADPGAAGAFAWDRLPGYRWVSSYWRSLSPYEFNPLNLNPLKDLLQRHVDCVALRDGPMRLFVTATSVHSGQARVFTREDMSLDALLASACLPHLFQAVEIDGEPYWDGGYTGNPALYPLIYDTESLDLLLVKINPLERAGTPRRNAEIMDRLSEITFNASLIGEMRAIAFVSRLVREGRLDSGRYKDLRLHMIADDAGLAPLGAASKMDTTWPFLERLFALGHAAASKWLKAHRADIGVRATLDIEGEFLGRRAAREAATRPGAKRRRPELP
ncbi:MAG: patatin-like phospholipase family protein [Rhizobacter sp.]|nr:patatin-like phospholipase family protein [Burkholderiaceae bacterium]MCO5124824.1 patatin-like phospholipase family protein [Rhizobacter sp.]